jgi:hypothetical protein
MTKKIELKPEAVALLQRVKAHILEEPLRLNMTDWVRRGERRIGEMVDDGEHEAVPPCGTVACVAGWVVELGAKRPKQIPLSTPDKAMQLLGIRGVDAWNVDLFFDNQWPAALRTAIRGKRPGTLPYAKVVAMAIERFIADPSEFIK